MGVFVKTSISTLFPPENDRVLLFVIDVDKGSTGGSEAGHRTLSEDQPLKHREKYLTGRVEEIEGIARLAAEADGARCNMLCTAFQ